MAPRERQLWGAEPAGLEYDFTYIEVGVWAPNATLLTTFRQSTVPADLSFIDRSGTPV